MIRLHGITPENLSRLELIVQSRLAGRIRYFRVHLGDNGLVLTGHACTYYAKQLVQHVLMDVTDLPIQRNEILVYQRDHDAVRTGSPT